MNQEQNNDFINQNFQNKSKKKNLHLIITICIVVLVIVGIVTYFITSNKNIQINEGNTNDKQNSTNENTNSDIAKTWLGKIEKSELKEPTYLYNSGFVLPITLKNIEKVEQSFKFWIDGVTTSASYGINITDINKITSDTTKFKSEVEVTTSETNTNLPDLYSINYSNDYITVSDSFNNNWWHLEEYTSDIGNNPSKVFGLENEYDVWDNNTMNSPVLEVIINKIGSPTCALFRYGNVDSDGWAFYYLAWEFKNYTIAIHVTETRNFSENYYSVYKLGGVQYYTPESWDYMKKSEEILSIYEF